MSDKLLEEANRAAHRVAREAIGYLEARAGEVNSRTGSSVTNPTRTTAEWYAEQAECYVRFSRAVDAYEEIEGRRQAEATR